MNGRLVLMVSLLFSKSLFGQTHADLKFAAEMHFGPTAHEITIAPASEIAAAVYAPYYLYKNYISSQDGNHCSFSPSCANYAIGTVSEFGLFPGILLSFDRLTRCNGSHENVYDWDYTLGIWLDPVPMYEIPE